MRLAHPTDLLISLDVRPREQSVSEAARRLHPSAPAGRSRTRGWCAPTSSTNSLRSKLPCLWPFAGRPHGRQARRIRVTDPADGEEENLIAPRIQAAVLLGTPGNGADLAAFASEHLPGHGHPLRGQAMRDALHLLARDFDRIAVPALRAAQKIVEPTQTNVFRTSQGTAMCLARVMANPPPAR